MSPEVLQAIKSQKKSTKTCIFASTLEGNDMFACGCLIGYMCSRGLHPFAHPVHESLPENIMEGRRARLNALGIVDSCHLQLVNKLTIKDPVRRWKVATALENANIL